MMIMYPRINGSREGSAAARQKIRAPLHKMISYAELVLEDGVSQSVPNVAVEVAKFLNLCETTLHQSQTVLDDSTIRQAETFEAARQMLLGYCSKLRTIAQELVRLTAGSPGDAAKVDAAKLCQTTDGLEAALRSLTSLDSRNEVQSEDKKPEALGRAQSGQNDDRLIADVEYRGLILVVDDDEGNRDVLSRRLLRDGYEVMLAESGRQALRMLNRYNFDLVLLDIMMPDMDGTAVLAELKRSPTLNCLPVIMVTAVDDIETIGRCIEAGADDYLLKPFNVVLLRARINALLERKRLQDEQKRQRSELETAVQESRRQEEKAQQLLLNILPAVVAEELRRSGSVQPMYFEDVTIVFADIVGFTLSTEQLPADELVEVLNEYFTACDRIISRYGLEKLKTIGDCYMFAGGLPVRNPSHPVDSVLAAMEMIHAMRQLSEAGKVDWQLRIGIHTGPVIAGVVGIHKFAFDIWGDAVNYTSRVEACGAPNRLNLSAPTFARVKDFFSCQKRERVRIKEGKEVEMYFVTGVAAGLLTKGDKSGLPAFQMRYSTYFRKPLQAFPEFIFDSFARSTELAGSDE